MCLKVLAFVLVLQYYLLVSADRKSCQRIQINHGKVQGECCVFINEKDKDAREELLGLLDPKMTTEMFLQHERGHVTEDSRKTIIGMVPLYKTVVQLPLNGKPDKPPIILIEQHQHQIPQQKVADHHHHHHHGQGDSEERLVTPPHLEPNQSDETIEITTPASGPVTEDDKNGNVTVGKTVLDNRNAIDVPVVECPAGQARDPSGRCVSEFT